MRREMRKGGMKERMEMQTGRETEDDEMTRTALRVMPELVVVVVVAWERSHS